MGMYSKKVKEHFMNPRNMGELKDPDAESKVGNPVCGDQMEIFLRIGKKNGKEYIKDIKFQTMGCAAAIATSSMVTELVKGKTLEEAKEVTKEDVEAELEGLPPVKQHCSELAEEAIQKAIENYEESLKA